LRERRSVLKEDKAERRLDVAEEKEEAMWEAVDGDRECVDGREGLIWRLLADFWELFLGAHVK
jgi:hypothetical protein